jgi:hypothetical protein
MFIRIFLIGLILFILTTVLAYSYRHLAKSNAKHTSKFIIGGGVTFVLLAVIAVLEA